MNVQPGDLARVVAPYVVPGRNAFVVVEHFVAAGDHKVGVQTYCITRGGAWAVRGWVRDEDGVPRGPIVLIGDECLRPIRDTGESEFIDAELQLAVPQGEPA